jgi:hypothetical protein
LKEHLRTWSGDGRTLACQDVASEPAVGPQKVDQKGEVMTVSAPEGGDISRSNRTRIHKISRAPEGDRPTLPLAKQVGREACVTAVAVDERVDRNQSVMEPRRVQVVLDSLTTSTLDRSDHGRTFPVALRLLALILRSALRRVFQLIGRRL